MTKIVNGEQITQEIAADIKQAVLAMDEKPVMGIVVVSQNPVTQSYVARKRRFAQSVGIPFVEKYLSEDISQDDLGQAIQDLSQTVDGLVVQLPLPQHIDTDQVLSLIPSTQDVDCLNQTSQTGLVAGPVAGAVMEILDRHQSDLNNLRIVVIGNGRLVGTPVVAALAQRGIKPSVIDINTDESEKSQLLANADVVISGVGIPDFVTPEMVKDGVVLIDAGTSSSRGAIRGDISADCVTKASLISPTPGGVGPVTIAKLFSNLLDLYHHKA